METIETIAADVVIAGGGIAGCVVAGRLAQRFPNLDIVLVEAGGDDRDDPLIETPLEAIFRVFTPTPSIDLIASQPGQALGDRVAVVPCGKVLGGGSSVNWMTYNNAAASDFDDWDQPGWSFEELRPYLGKYATFDGSSIEQELHGSCGPVHLSYSSQLADFGVNMAAAFKDAHDVPFVYDLTDHRTAHGFGRHANFVNPETGRRSTASDAYIHLPIARIRVLYHHIVDKVLSADSEDKEGKHAATGVLAVCSTDVSRKVRITARRQVILSAGSLASPLILERSGIGSPEILGGCNIPLRISLPGVGKEYQDHQFCGASYRVRRKPNVMDKYLQGEEEVVREQKELWAKTGKGVLAATGIEWGFKVRPTEAQRANLGTDFNELWTANNMSKTDKPLFGGICVPFLLGDRSKSTPGTYTSLAAWLAYPGSKGRIHISNADPAARPDFHTNMLEHPADLAAHIWVYKWLREVARRMSDYAGEVVSTHPSFPPGSKAACEEEGAPVSGSTSLAYSAEDDEAIAQWARKNVGTTWHSISTCAMKARDEDGVVDAKLDVYGTTNLKVIDNSIVPRNVGCNTASIAFIIGEKGADIVSEPLA